MQENYTQLHFTVKTPPVAKGRPKFSRRGAYVQAYTPTKTTNAEREVARGFLSIYPEFAASASDKSVLSRVELGKFADMAKKSRKDRYACVSSSNARNADRPNTSEQYSTEKRSGTASSAKNNDFSGNTGRNTERWQRNDDRSSRGLAARTSGEGSNERDTNSQKPITIHNRFNGCREHDVHGPLLPCEQLKREAREHGIALTCEFYCPIPSSLSKRKREQLNGELCLKKPDIDNYVKLVCDALNGIAWEDDNVVASLYAVKLYDNEPRTEVYIDYLQNNA